MEGIGTPVRSRTGNLRIKSPLRYQLRHGGIVRGARWAPGAAARGIQLPKIRVGRRRRLSRGATPECAPNGALVLKREKPDALSGARLLALVFS
jgi:hypothetical protein